jgi:hypothetical protein
MHVPAAEGQHQDRATLTHSWQSWRAAACAWCRTQAKAAAGFAVMDAHDKAEAGCSVPASQL